MGEYDRFIAMAVRMIGQKGQAVEWKKLGPDGGTPAKPISGMAELFPCSILFLPHKKDGLSAFFSMFPDAPDVPTGGMRGLMASQSFQPLPVDTVIRGSEELVLDPKNGVDVLAPDGTPILYYLRFTR